MLSGFDSVHLFFHNVLASYLNLLEGCSDIIKTTKVFHFKDGF